MSSRIDRTEYYLEIAKLTSKRSTCRVQVGAIAVKDKRVIMSGYNGGLSGKAHCLDVGCKMVDNHCIRTIHAEQNLITQCAKAGISLDGANIFVTHCPCMNCIKLLIASGVKIIFYIEDYGNLAESWDILELKRGDIQLVQYGGEL